MNNSFLQSFGRVLVVAGLLGFLAAIVLSFTPLSGKDAGALPAASFFAVMLGFAFAFPSLLEENAGQLSTMRIIVFAVTMVFCIIYVKIGWTTGSFENFSIDQRWVYILGLAFGSKAFQKFGENSNNTTNNGGNNPPVG